MTEFLPASLMGGGIAATLVFILAAPAMRGPRAWLVPVAVLAAFCDEFFLDLPDFRNDPLDFIGGHWNWTGKLFELIAAILFMLALIGWRKFSRRDFGLTFRQQPGTLRAVLLVLIPYTVIVTALIWKMSSHDIPNTETIAFQLTMPGFAEELYFRGLLLALFDAMFTGRRTILGAPMGYGAIASTIAFAGAHTFGVHRDMTIDFSLMPAIAPFLGGFVAAWVRARSGSLVLPVVFHNLINTLGEIVPMFA